MFPCHEQGDHHGHGHAQPARHRHGTGTRMALKTYSAEDYSADRARGAEIVLRRLWERIVFLGGLVGTVLLLVIAQFIWR